MIKDTTEGLLRELRECIGRYGVQCSETKNLAPSNELINVFAKLNDILQSIHTTAHLSGADRCQKDHDLAQTVHLLKQALQFYADRQHFDYDYDQWDTVSGEPQNYYCDEAGTATVEDGTIAKRALLGLPVDCEQNTEQMPEPPAISLIRKSTHPLSHTAIIFAYADALRDRCQKAEAELIRQSLRFTKLLEKAEAECIEQARLLGIGGERELALMAKLEAVEKENARLMAGLREQHKILMMLPNAIRNSTWRTQELRNAAAALVVVVSNTLTEEVNEAMAEVLIDKGG